jgi:hypothetical protein
MKLTGENRQLGEKPVPVPLCPPQTPHGLDPGSNIHSNYKCSCLPVGTERISYFGRSHLTSLRGTKCSTSKTCLYAASDRRVSFFLNCFTAVRSLFVSACVSLPCIIFPHRYKCLKPFSLQIDLFNFNTIT